MDNLFPWDYRYNGGCRRDSSLLLLLLLFCYRTFLTFPTFIEIVERRMNINFMTGKGRRVSGYCCVVAGRKDGRIDGSSADSIIMSFDGSMCHPQIKIIFSNSSGRTRKGL